MLSLWPPCAVGLRRPPSGADCFCCWGSCGALRMRRVDRVCAFGFERCGPPPSRLCALRKRPGSASRTAARPCRLWRSSLPRCRASNRSMVLARVRASLSVFTTWFEFSRDGAQCSRGRNSAIGIGNSMSFPYPAPFTEVAEATERDIDYNGPVTRGDCARTSRSPPWLATRQILLGCLVLRWGNQPPRPYPLSSVTPCLVAWISPNTALCSQAVTMI